LNIQRCDMLEKKMVRLTRSDKKNWIN